MTDGEPSAEATKDVPNETISRDGSVENFSVLVQAIDAAAPGALFKTRLSIGAETVNVLVRVLHGDRMYVEVSGDAHLHGDVYSTNTDPRAVLASVIGDATEAWYHENFDAGLIPEHQLEE